MAKKTVADIAQSTGATLNAAEFAKLKANAKTVTRDRGEILILEKGQGVGPLKVARVSHGVVVDDAKPEGVTVYEAEDNAGKLWRLPIKSIFLDKMAQIKATEGDSIIIFRSENDIEKLRGKGKGTMMADYDIAKL